MITVGNSVMGLYNLVHVVYHRYMADDQHISYLSMDDLVMRSQELADMYVQAFDTNPGARVDSPTDRDTVEQVFQALARFVLASDLALRFVASYAAGDYDVTDGDF